jgi:UDP-N-acetylmuramoylalanine--D-glutamate ligase
MELSGKNIVIVGLGRSGLSAARQLLPLGARVTLNDIKSEGDLDPDLLKEVRSLGIDLESGGHRPGLFLDKDMIIISPGVPHDIEPLNRARDKGIAIIGELELASRLVEVPVIAITGTNGKSTTTAFIGRLLKNAGFKTFVGGNIGTPLMDYLAWPEKADYAVVEVSSFQLDSMSSFNPQISILLNLSPDHLDRYPDYQAYIRSKLKIFSQQGPGQFAILNDDDQVLSTSRPPGGVSVLRYGEKAKKGRHAYLSDREVIASIPGSEILRFDLSRFALPGRHNLENLLAAVLTGLALNAEPAAIQKTIDRFQGLPHRLYRVGEVGGVDFYDDSKATNVDSAVRSIRSFDRPVIAIAGGRHKGADYSPLLEASKGRVKKAVLIGEARNLIAESFEGVIPYAFAEDMEDAVIRAFSSADTGEVVLLAPACSSFDMFTDYAHRGRIFQEAVLRLDNGR